MRDAAVLAAEIAHRRRQVDDGNAPPGQPDGRFRVEIEAPHPAGFLEYPQQRRNRIDAEAEQRIADSRPQASPGPPRKFEIRWPTTRIAGALASNTGTPSTIASGCARDRAMSDSI